MKKLTYQEVKEYIESFGYELLSKEYKGCESKIKIKCPHNHEYDVRFRAFKNQGQRCPKCASEHRNDDRKLTYDYVKQYIESFGYILLSTEYKNANEKIKISCPMKHEYEVTFGNFQSGKRCSCCDISKGEQRIMDCLNKNNIKYIYDSPYFQDLLSPLGFPLRPDFIIENKKVWIEFDGKFHFEKVYNGDGHEKMIIHDELKNKYAKENGWKLIRIPYWDFDNIEKIIVNELELE